MDIHQPVFITGAASGLGAACATLFSSFGGKVFLLDKNKLQPNILPCDITDENQLATIFNQFSDIPRIYVHCAGIVHAKKILKMTTAEFRNVIEINLVGAFNVMKAAAHKIQELPPLNENGERGVIINVASIAAFEGQKGQSAYSASKGGIVGMTLPLARELADLGIRVVTIAPGVMETPMFDALREDVRESIVKGVPFPKRLGHPEEFAHLVKHIVENPYINGTVIRLDGGCRLS
jgi:NAD(P)-dependent dehydrogenase (short-subunit alcohol dehydrogenase family)